MFQNCNRINPSNSILMYYNIFVKYNIEFFNSTCNNNFFKNKYLFLKKRNIFMLNSIILYNCYIFNDYWFFFSIINSQLRPYLLVYDIFLNLRLYPVSLIREIMRFSNCLLRMVTLIMRAWNRLFHPGKIVQTVLNVE